MTAPLASRTVRLTLADGKVSEVGVVLGTPAPDPHSPRPRWLCPYTIAAFDERTTRAIFGNDAMQALVLALHTLPTELAALAREAGAVWVDDPSLGITTACRTVLELA